MRKTTFYVLCLGALAFSLMLPARLSTRAAGQEPGAPGRPGVTPANYRVQKPKRRPNPFVERGVKVLRLHTGETPGEWFGWVGARLGDLNGDGANEYLIPAPNANNSNGRFVVYSGRDGRVLSDVRAESVQGLGYSAADAGDVDGDGVRDYIVGGPYAGGRAIVYSGESHQELRRWTGATASFFGASVSGAGDLNLDGLADVIVGAPSEAAGAGVTYAYSGADSAQIWSSVGLFVGGGLGSGLGPLGDVNDDGYPDVVSAAPGAGTSGLGEAYVLSGFDGSVLLTVTPPGPPTAPSGTFGTFFTVGAGDVDHDGYPDIFIGDYAAEAGNGAATVYSGKSGAVIFHFAGQPGEGLGPGRPVEDLDGDGYLDFVIAGWTYGPNQEGRAYFFSGKDGSVMRTVTGTIALDNLGVDALSLGDLNRDGRPEFLLTAVGNDFAAVDVGRSYVVSLAPFKKRR